MYIFKNDAGIELTVDEFIELLDNDYLPELITIVAYIDAPDFLAELIETNETDNEQMERLFRRFIGNE